MLLVCVAGVPLTSGLATALKRRSLPVLLLPLLILTSLHLVVTASREAAARAALHRYLVLNPPLVNQGLVNLHRSLNWTQTSGKKLH